MRRFPRLALAIIFVGLTRGLVALGLWARGRDSGAPVVGLEDRRFEGAGGRTPSRTGFVGTTAAKA